MSQPRNRSYVKVPSGAKLLEAYRKSPTPRAIRHAIIRLCGIGIAPLKTGPGEAGHAIAVYKQAISQAAHLRMAGHEPDDGPIWLECRFIFPRPKNKTWKNKPMPEYPHTAKPDLDNLVKGVKDALTGIAYRDDAQVARESAEKIVAAGGEGPRTLIAWGPILRHPSTELF